MHIGTFFLNTDDGGFAFCAKSGVILDRNLKIRPRTEYKMTGIIVQSFPR
jgi:hypothetical protein